MARDAIIKAIPARAPGDEPEADPKAHSSPVGPARRLHTRQANGTGRPSNSTSADRSTSHPRSFPLIVASPYRSNAFISATRLERLTTAMRRPAERPRSR